MEIIPVPSVRRRRTGRLALAALAVALVLAGLVAALPVLLGLERVAMADDAMGGTLPKGSYVLVRQVPATQVRVGDVLSFRDPGGSGSAIRRVGALDGGWVTLTGDASGAEAEPRRAVRLRRVVSHVPWVGYPMLVLPRWPAPYLVTAMLGGLILLGLRITDRRRRRAAAAVTFAADPRGLGVPAPRAAQEPSVTSLADAPEPSPNVAEPPRARTA